MSAYADLGYILLNAFNMVHFCVSHLDGLPKLKVPHRVQVFKFVICHPFVAFYVDQKDL